MAHRGDVNSDGLLAARARLSSWYGSQYQLASGTPLGLNATVPDTLVPPAKVEPTPEEKHKSARTDELLAMNTKLLETGNYSDVVIKCQGSGFLLHRSVVCSQSKPFAAMMNGKFLEASTGVIDLDDDDLGAVKRMIDYLYTSDYTDSVQSADGSPRKVENALLNNVLVYIIADKYDIASLRKLAVIKYTRALNTDGLSRRFTKSVAYLYDQTMDTDMELKNVAIGYAAARGSKLAEEKHATGYLELSVSYPEFHRAVLKATESKLWDGDKALGMGSVEKKKDVPKTPEQKPERPARFI